MPFEDGIGPGRPRPAEGTEGTASIILTLKDKQEPLELNGCIIANDENFKKLFEDDTILEQHEKTKFFIYFCCHENLKLSNLVETEIKVHRFTKPDRDKHCTIKHATDGVFFLQKECHVFLPVCHKDLKTMDFKEFCEKHSKKIPSQCHPIVKGRYKGTRKVTLPEKGSVKCEALELTSLNGHLFMEDSSINKLVDGPLLLHSNEVVGYYNKEQDGSRMTVYKLGTQDTTTIQPIPTATQAVISTASGFSTLSAQGLELYSVNLKEAIKRNTDLQDKKMTNQISVKTDDIFTNLTLHHQEQNIPHQRAQEVVELARETLHGRLGFLHQERTHKVNQGARKTVTEIKQCREIFVGENNPKSILVSGEPGIGKTLFSQKIVRDWSTNTLMIPDIKFTYLITFRQLTQLANKELTVRGLLNHSLLLDENTMITEEIMAYIVRHPAEQLFIVFDGFDEYKDRDKIMGDFQEQFPNDVKAEMPVTALVSKLIRKKILRDSVTMITSRPSEANALNENIHFDRYVEITGFSESQVVKYVENYFKSKPEEVKKLAVDKVKGSPHHISFGRAPFRCFLMCIFIECEVENNRDISVPATLTKFYDNVIKCIERNYNREILKLHHSDKKAASEAVDKTIDNFAELAANLTQQDRFSFTSEDLENLNSTEKEMLLSSNLIFCYPVSSNSPYQKPTCEYSFTHFTIQEFFVALYLVKKGVMAAQESTEKVYTFMSGLLGLDKDKESMVKLLECLGEHIKDKERLRLVSLRCLHEFQDKGLTEQEVTTNRDYRYWDRDGWHGLEGVTDDTDCAAIAMLVESTATSISSPPHRLYIGNSSITSVGVERLLLSLVHSNHTITVLSLFHCGLNDECAECLGKYLLKTKITELHLSNNEITDGGVQHIMVHLPSNLTVLNLCYNGITDGGVQHIMEHIPSNLTKLNLYGNKITDGGVQHIMEHIPSNLTKLHLGYNEITDDGVQHIMEHIPSNLTELDLSDIEITDGGVQHIMEHIPSNLTELNLYGNEISNEVRESSKQFCEENHPGLKLFI